ncbi:hypothetical protein J3Q64DRAFT_1750930 [Phycomyces blakesleeanus]|uniref:Bardet-Biedl syndrome 1 N-terminal domain-containing protein n=2 Tax=Phycomyces blakesleeanus TaxID=4837 RepID=A0A162UVP6_PHYB8|nr:hypothetical protein PHYBLDRAFT_163411 [Phycomyces blakesleeanus NRRL 1555(-)]OAD78292.1 hypothetical protein PHYBLDRAFT_163411 [Phycomyces blakesleeanus NRRL 1555(-)]|eukprot:XP_018296332.1 hypothetical protein PHYBLDRAFT_163411 [Phycomyces blakesleeanus NRRL 1555(-)]
MDLNDANQWRLGYDKLWASQLDDPINCLAVGKPFLEELSEENDVLVGTTAGRVLILNQTKPVEGLLDTKGNSIQALKLHDLTGYGALDLVVGDSDGVVTLFSRQQILSKRELGSAVMQIEIYEDQAGGYEIIAGDMHGTLTSFQQHDALWKLNVAEESAKVATLGIAGRRSPYIRCVLSTTLKDLSGLNVSCLLACDGWPFVHFVQEGEKIMTLRVPSIIHSMCAGHFLTTSTEKSLNDQQPKAIHAGQDVKINSKQVLLAGEDGNVYILVNFEVYLWFTVGICLTNILTFRPSWLLEEEPDIIICAGQSNGVYIYHGRKMVGEITTADWPHAMTMGDVNADGQDELVLGLLDQTVEVYRLNQIKSKDEMMMSC